MPKYIKEIIIIVLLVLIVGLNRINNYDALVNLVSIIFILIIYIVNNHKIFDLYLINNKIISNNMMNIVINIVFPFVIYLTIYSQISMNSLILFTVMILELILISINLISLSINRKIKVEYFNQRIKNFFQLLVFVVLFVSMSINSLIIIDMISLILISYAVYLMNYTYEMLAK